MTITWGYDPSRDCQHVAVHWGRRKDPLPGQTIYQHTWGLYWLWCVRRT